MVTKTCATDIMDGVRSASGAQSWVRTKDSPVTTNLLIVCELSCSWWQPPVIDNSVQDYDYRVLRKYANEHGWICPHCAFPYLGISTNSGKLTNV